MLNQFNSIKGNHHYIYLSTFEIDNSKSTWESFKTFNPDFIIPICPWCKGLNEPGIKIPEKELDKFVKNYLVQKNGENYMRIHNQIKSDKAMNAIKKRISISKDSRLFPFKIDIGIDISCPG